MEVHHHPDVHHKKKSSKNIPGILNDISCRNAWLFCRKHQRENSEQ